MFGVGHTDQNREGSLPTSNQDKCTHYRARLERHLKRPEIVQARCIECGKIVRNGPDKECVQPGTILYLCNLVSIKGCKRTYLPFKVLRKFLDRQEKAFISLIEDEKEKHG